MEEIHEKGAIFIKLIRDSEKTFTRYFYRKRPEIMNGYKSCQLQEYTIANNDMLQIRLTCGYTYSTYKGRYLSKLGLGMRIKMPMRIRCALMRI